MITVNLDKAKSICHEKRRQFRAKEFAPLDIKATIPSEEESAELARQAIRQKYAEIQANIDSADKVETLKTIISSLE